MKSVRSLLGRSQSPRTRSDGEDATSPTSPTGGKQKQVRLETPLLDDGGSASAPRGTRVRLGTDRVDLAGEEVKESDSREAPRSRSFFSSARPSSKPVQTSPPMSPSGSSGKNFFGRTKSNIKDNDGGSDGDGEGMTTTKSKSRSYLPNLRSPRKTSSRSNSPALSPASNDQSPKSPRRGYTIFGSSSPKNTSAPNEMTRTTSSKKPGMMTRAAKSIMGSSSNKQTTSPRPHATSNASEGSDSKEGMVPTPSSMTFRQSQAMEAIVSHVFSDGAFATEDEGNDESSISETPADDAYQVCQVFSDGAFAESDYEGKPTMQQSEAPQRADVATPGAQEQLEVETWANERRRRSAVKIQALARGRSVRRQGLTVKSSSYSGIEQLRSNLQELEGIWKSFDTKISAAAEKRDQRLAHCRSLLRKLLPNEAPIQVPAIVVRSVA